MTLVSSLAMDVDVRVCKVSRNWKMGKKMIDRKNSVIN